jgi:hypothetical protein
LGYGDLFPPHAAAVRERSDAASKPGNMLMARRRTHTVHESDVHACPGQGIDETDGVSVPPAER